MPSKVIKVIGIVATITGMAASLASDWVNEQKMDEKINEKIEKLISTTNKES